MADLIQKRRVEDGVYEVNLCDAPGQNHLRPAMLEALDEAFAEMEANAELKVLLLTGLPEVFCAGASRDVLDSLPDDVSSGRSRLRFDYANRVLSFPMPVIAAMEGHAVGGGLVMALACDMAIAASESRYGLNFTELGFTPGMGTFALLPGLVGPHLAAEMIMTGKLYQGSELRERGVFNDVLPRDQVYPRALDLARRIAEKPAHVLSMCKETIAVPRRQALSASVSRERLMHQVCFSR